MKTLYSIAFGFAFGWLVVAGIFGFGYLVEQANEKWHLLDMDFILGAVVAMVTMVVAARVWL